MPTGITPATVLRRRLAVQQLTREPADAGTTGAGPASTGPASSGQVRATDVVALLTCVQSQEQAQALWSLGMRTGLDEAAVRRELDEAHVVRTHVLRPTWHFVAAADVRWIQALTAPRVQQANATQFRRTDLTPAVLDRAAGLILEALAGGRYQSRPELAAVLRAGGIEADGQRLAYVLMHAELEALICSGPLRGTTSTYAVLDERVPPTPTRSADAMLAELTWRFFSGHGPAEVKDFTRWSSLTLSQARSGLEMVGDRLQRAVVDGLELWYDPARGGPLGDDEPDRPEPGAPPVLLTPLYDEVTLSYPRLNFPPASDHPHPRGYDTYTGSVLAGTQNVGAWRRTIRGRRVTVETWLAPGLPSATLAAVQAAVQRLAAFLGRELEVVPPGPPPAQNRAPQGA